MADDAVTLLTRDHRNVETLFQRFEAAPAAEYALKRELIDEIIKELSIHAGIEEQVLYPYIREHVPGGEGLASEGLEEHQEATELLHQLEQADEQDPQFETLARKLIADVRHHVEEEEGEFFPALQAAAGSERLADLGEKLQTAKRLAPTRPHPEAPDTPPGNLAAGPVAGVADRVRDALGGDG